MATILHKQDELFEGFTIRFEALPELEHISDILDGMEDADEVLADIQNYDVMLFMARVTARRAGVELAETFLGGCLYTTYVDFIAEGGYYEDMRGEVIKAAGIKLAVMQIADSKAG